MQKKCCKKRTFNWCNFSCIFKKNRLDERRPEVNNYLFDIARYIDQKAILSPSGRSIICLVYKKTGLKIYPFSRIQRERLLSLGAHITCLASRIKAFHSNVKLKKQVCFIFSSSLKITP